MTYSWEAHTFRTIRTDRYGRTTEGAHIENINVAATHLVMVPIDVDGDEFPYLAIRCFDENEANDTACAHGVTDIWARTETRAFAPIEASHA